VAGNGRYYLAPFVYRGLVSDEHDILKLFVAKVPRARGLLTGDDKGKVSRADSKLHALDSAYVTVNALMRGVLCVDVDQDFTVAELVAGLTRCGVPLPNIVVGHRDAAGRFLRPHLIWLLENSVTCTGKGRHAPRSLLSLVLKGLTAALLPLGADPGMTNTGKVKNPVSPLWSRVVLAERPYALLPGPGGAPALAPHLDLDTAHARLRAATGQARAFTPDHPDPEVLARSNGPFRHVQGFAFRHVAQHRDHGAGSYAEFLAEVSAEALRIFPAGSASERAACGLADNVAAWTWKKYRTRPAKPRTPEEVRARLVAGQAKGAASRRCTTLAAVAEAIQTLTAAGLRVTQVAVAAASRKARDTVRQHWAAALAAAAECTIHSPPIAKKGASSCRAAERPASAVPEVHGLPTPAAPPLGAAPAEPAGGLSGTAGAALSARPLAASAAGFPSVLAVPQVRRGVDGSCRPRGAAPPLTAPPAARREPIAAHGGIVPPGCSTSGAGPPLD
jgi:hypothetical protein